MNKLSPPHLHTVTIGVQGVIIADTNRILLVRHTYRAGWHFPGGGVERGETVEDALSRELREEAGVALSGPAELFGLYSHFDEFPGDHIALFCIRKWEMICSRPSGFEIRDRNFFDKGNLPSDTAQSVPKRLSEIFDHAPRSAAW